MRVQEVFAKNLRAERKRLGLSQEKAAERIGISLSFYQTLELATKFPSPEKISDIADSFQVRVYKLFVDIPQVTQLAPNELLDMFVEFLDRKYRSDLTEAKSEFLQNLESLGKGG